MMTPNWTLRWYYFGDVVCRIREGDGELTRALLQIADREGEARLQEVLLPKKGGSELPAVIRSLPSIQARQEPCYPWANPWPAALRVEFCSTPAGAREEVLLRPDLLQLPWPLKYPNTAEGKSLEKVVSSFEIIPPGREYDERRDVYLNAAMRVSDHLVVHKPDEVRKYPSDNARDAVLAEARQDSSTDYLQFPDGTRVTWSNDRRTDETELASGSTGLHFVLGLGVERCKKGRQKGARAIDFREWPCGAL